MTEFTVGVRVGRSTAIAPRGELDLATAKRFETACDAIDYSTVVGVVLDLRELEFIDATGLRAVLRLRAICLERAVQLLVRPGPRGVQRVFELTHTDRLLTFSRPDGVDMSRLMQWRTNDSR